MPRSTRPKAEAVALEQVPLILSEWRHMARSRLLSDRQLYAAALAAYEAYRELKDLAGEEAQKKWTAEEQRRRA